MFKLSLFNSSPARWIIALLTAAAFLTPWTAFAQSLPGAQGGYTTINAPALPAAPGGGSGPQTTLVIEGLAGINTAPISSTLRQALLSDWNASGQPSAVTYFVNPQGIDAIERSLANGSVDPYLQPYTNSSSAGCSDLAKTKTRNFPLNWNGTSYNSPVGSFTGDLDLQADLSGNAKGVFKYRIKRFGLFGVCAPYWIKFDSFRLQGTATLDGDVSLSGSLSNSQNPWQWSQQITKLHLNATEFWIGPIYVKIGYNLPISVGVQTGVTVQANVDFENEGVSTGSFDYTCRSFNNCTGHSNFNAQNLANPQAITSSIQGRADVQAYVDVALRAYLYSESVAYAQVGVRPKAFVDLWGYWGNNCGDVDCDESAEAIAALTASIDWQISINAKARALGRTWKWDDLWQSNRYHLAFVDFLNSAALDPMLHGPGTVRVNDLVNYQARMRPCWPYDDAMTYEVVWQDGSVNTFTKAPDEYQDLNHYFPNAGSQPVTVTALHDAHGRTLNRSTTRDIQVTVFGNTEDPDCSEGGTDTSGGGGSGTSGPTAQMSCSAQVIFGNPGWQMNCSGSGQNGLAPYTYQWRYKNGSWQTGSSTKSFVCQALNDPISFRVRDSNGLWSSAKTAHCPGGIG